MTPAESFAVILRAEARKADEIAAVAAQAHPDIADRNTRAADHLRLLADDVGSIDGIPERLAQMSDEDMREFARAARIIAGH
jgi:hypothetical protein